MWIPVIAELNQASFAPDLLINVTADIRLVISVTDNQWIYIETQMN